ncbi:MAG: alpha/beta fold hydrolase [Gaiellaceae bacterium]
MILHAYEWGDTEAPPVVCLHGVTGHAGRYRPLAERRLGARFRVISVDLRGHGQSSWDPPWSIAAHVADLIETTDALGAGRACWIGHSYGGRILMELASAHPERVERAVLLDPAIWIPPPAAGEYAERERRDRVWASVEEAVEERFAEGTLLPAARRVMAADMAERLVPGEDGLLRPNYSLAAAVTSFSEMASPPSFPAVPLLVVRGERSIVTPGALVDLCRESARSLELVDVPGFHNVLWDAFDETADAIEAFLG